MLEQSIAALGPVVATEYAGVEGTLVVMAMILYSTLTLLIADVVLCWTTGHVSVFWSGVEG